MKSIYIHKIKEEGLDKYLPSVNMTERDKEIVSKYLVEKPTYQILADTYDISGERVRQILEKFARKADYLYKKELQVGD